MEFPIELQAKINELTEHENTKKLSEIAVRLSERYRDERSDGKRSASDRLDILVYAAVRMPATFAAVSRALELSLGCFDGDIHSILDVGAGTGAGAIAASLLTGCTKLSCVERERNMIDLGRQFFDRMDIHGEWIERDISLGIPEKADLVICSYCLNELPETKRKAAVSQLAGAANKMLLIVEPGTPREFSGMLQIRGELIRQGLAIAAPCPSAEECPLPVGDWCHFTARAARSRLHKQLKGAEVPYEDEKFCFIAAAKSGAVPCEMRIRRHPFIESGKVTLQICSAEGISARLVTKKSPLFKAARKAENGDIFKE